VVASPRWPRPVDDESQRVAARDEAPLFVVSLPAAARDHVAPLGARSGVAGARHHHHDDSGYGGTDVDAPSRPVRSGGVADVALLRPRVSAVAGVRCCRCEVCACYVALMSSHAATTTGRKRYRWRVARYDTPSRRQRAGVPSQRRRACVSRASRRASRAPSRGSRRSRRISTVSTSRRP